MTRKETEPQIRVSMFDDSSQFDKFLLSHGMGYGFGTGSKGRLADDGSIEVAINKRFFIHGGIKKYQLQAIVEHERIELTSSDPDRHLAATVGEYRYIFEHFGERELADYHTNLCNLYGGSNDVRNQALRTILGT